MASSPYPLRRGILDVPQQALVLKVLYDATEDGAFRFESAESVVFKVWSPVGPGQQREPEVSLRGWMKFTTSKNAKEFIKHWSRVIQIRLQTRETPFLIAVDHAARAMEQEAFSYSVQKLMLNEAFLTTSGVHWGNLYRALYTRKLTLPPGDVRPSDAMPMPSELMTHLPRLETAPGTATTDLDAQDHESAQAAHPNDFKIGARSGPVGMQPYGQVPAIGPVHATKAFPFPIVPFGRPFIAPFSIPPPPNTPRHLMPPPAKRILPPQSVTSTFATLASKTNAAPTVKPATLSLQLQPDKAAHLNTAAPAFVPRLLRTCTQTAAQNTGAKPPSTPAQPMLANARPAADLEKPKVLREFIPQHLMSSKQSPVHSGQQTQALQMSSAQPAAHTELLTHAEPAAEQPQQQGASDIQPAAALTHSASVAPALAVEAAQQDHHAVQSIAELNQAAVQSDQSGAALQHHMSQVDEQSTPQEDQHDLQYGARQDQLELPGPSEQFDQPAAAQNQSAGIANADMHSVASSGSLDTELHALDDATEQEASTLVDSEDAVPLSTLLDTLYMHYPLSLLPVVSVSAYRKPVAKAQELELLVHRGSEVAHQKQEIWACREQSELELWESFVVEAQQ